MARKLQQEYLITNEFDKKMAYTGLKTQLESQIFTDLINYIDKQNWGIKVIFIIETLEDEPNE